MFNLKHKLPILILGALVIVGTIDEWFFWDPQRGKALVNHLPGAIIAIIALGAPIVGWIYLMFGKDQLKPRLHWVWTPLGLLMFAWGWLTVFNTAALEYGLSANTLITASPELWRNSGIGLLFAFYSLESAKPLWYFYWFWGLAGVIMYAGGALIPLCVIFPQLAPSLGLTVAGGFWQQWGYFFLDAYIVPLAYVTWYHIIKWRKSALEKEGEKRPLVKAFLQGIGLPFALLRDLRKTRRKRVAKRGPSLSSSTK